MGTGEKKLLTIVSLPLSRSTNIWIIEVQINEGGEY